MVWGLLLGGCQTTNVSPVVDELASLVLVAESMRQWTGVAVSQEERVFVTYPRWSEGIPFTVGEVDVKANTITPFPSGVMNAWGPGLAPEEHLICVQALYVDEDDFLWILDPANPMFKGVVPNGPKLLKVDLDSDEVVQRILFDATVAPAQSYLNDVRVDVDAGFAYMTDSGLGGIVVTNLATGESVRRLTEHPSTKSENIPVIVSGKPWLNPDGGQPQVHSDGIALDASGTYLYYHALTGSTLYRVPTAALRDNTLDEAKLAEQVEALTKTGPMDGMMFGEDGNLYLASLEDAVIKRYTDEGIVEVIVHDKRLSWPDSFAMGPKGTLYVTTAQIHVPVEAVEEPYRLFCLVWGEPKRDDLRKASQTDVTVEGAKVNE